MSDQPNADDRVDFQEVLAEMKKRDLQDMIARNGDSEEVRKAHAAAWNTNPACPDCGSFEHFEC
jgi:hypothetical protein